MPYFLYRIQLAEKYRDAANRNEHFNNTIQAHFGYLKNLCDQGVVWIAGRTDVDLENPDNHGICIFEVENMEAAQAFTANDPAMKAGVMNAEVFPFSLALWKDSK